MRKALFASSAVALFMVLAAAATGAASAQTPPATPTPPAGPTMRVVNPSGSVASSAKQFDVSIEVANVTDLAGFQFVLVYDPRILRALSASKTTFLAKTGREIVCGTPVIDAGAIRMACVTLRPLPLGVDGAGTIATVAFKPLTNGTSDLVLKNVKLAHRDGTEEPVTAISGRLTVSGASWWTTAHVILVIAAAGVALLVVAGAAVVIRSRGGSGGRTGDGAPGAGAAGGPA